ncbi:tRNA (carboxymethyluridine(34)-5-O)-methyltransferase alkbh8-like [Ciona intestinalis]
MSEALKKRQKKKKRKICAKLQAYGLQIDCNPTSTVVIANAGIGNMVCSTELTHLVSQYGDCILLKLDGKSYAVVQYKNTESAKCAAESLEGHQMVKQTQNEFATFYCFYSNNIPQEDVIFAGEKSDLPNGLIKIENFLNKEEEQALINCIQHDISILSNDHVSEKLKHRTVLHYGYKFRYGTNDVDINNPISEGLPNYIENLLDRIMATGYLPSRPDQLTINMYEPGDGIPPHTDNTRSFDGVLSTVSLGSHTVMNFSKEGAERIDVCVEPRTLFLFTGESRYEWRHGIQQRKFDILDQGEKITTRTIRYSLTFRTVVKDAGKSGCTQKEEFLIPENESDANSLESSHVHSVYDKIADHFSSTREKPWPHVVEFLQSLPRASVVLDVGCGSGRYLGVCQQHFMLGCDRSVSLINICRQKNFPSFVCNGLKLPVREGSFDACICIAVIHHYATENRRIQAIKELLRAVRIGGKILIYAWAIEQTCNNVKSKYLKKNAVTSNQEHIESDVSSPKDGKQKLAVHVNRTSFVQQDLLVPWKSKNVNSKSNNSCSTYLRYYHVFKENELQSLCSQITECSVLKSYHDNGNWCVILEKV